MNNFIDKFRRRKQDNNNQTINNNNGHRDSLTTDHIYIPQTSSTDNPSCDISTGDNDHIGVQVRKRPQLAYSLDRLLADASALSYFIQFLEASDKLNLIKFWMHVQGFKASFADGNETAQDLTLRDAKSIYDKYVDESSASSLVFPKKIKNAVDEEMSNAQLSPNCFDAAQNFVKQLFEYRYFEEFQASIYYKKHELEALSSGCSLTDVIKVQSLLLSFLDFIKEKEDNDMLQFLLACDSFESNFHDMDDNEALDDAMALYDKYFSMQANNMIDVGAPIRGEIESLICHESGRPDWRCFKTPKTICHVRLHDKYISSFLQSKAFEGYLCDLRNFIETTIELPRKNRDTYHSGSSSSDVPSSTDSLNNAFNRHIKQIEKKMDIDRTPTATPSPSRRLSTPRSGSRLAEIDELGRYHALYDDTHIQSNIKTPIRIKSTIRKYLDKNMLHEEEIAEEVAKSIIQDMQTMVASGSAPI